MHIKTKSQMLQNCMHNELQLPRRTPRLAIDCDKSYARGHSGPIGMLQAANRNIAGCDQNYANRGLCLYEWQSIGMSSLRGRTSLEYARLGPDLVYSYWSGFTVLG